MPIRQQAVILTNDGLFTALLMDCSVAKLRITGTQGADWRATIEFICDISYK